MNKHHTVTAAAIFGGIVAAGILVACGADNTPAQDAAHPATTVTAPAVTTTVQQVPQACLDALDQADEGFTYAGAAMQASSDGFTAVSRLDVPGIKAATRDMNAATAKLGTLSPQYNASKEACRAAAGN